MKFLTRQVALAAFLVAGLAGSTGAVLAATPDAGPYTRDNIDPAHPFGSTPVNITDVTYNGTADWVSSSAPSVVEDVSERCAVIVDSPFKFGADTAAFCSRVFYATGVYTLDNAAPASSSSEGGSALSLG